MTLAKLLANYLGTHSLTVIDVGARWGAQHAWYRVPPLARLIGFDPDEAECARLNASSPEGCFYVPLALHKFTGTARLHTTADPACSSFYEPDQRLAERYPGLQCIRHAGEKEVPVTTLDTWVRTNELAGVSFIKVDTQGSELDVLEGAVETLVDCVGLQVEVEFSAIYHRQPLFSDIDPWLRRQAFHLWQFTELTSYPEKRSAAGRLFWANAVYFRDFRSKMSGPQRLLLASLFDALGDTDSAYSCCEIADAPGPIMDYFREPPGPE